MKYKRWCWDQCNIHGISTPVPLWRYWRSGWVSLMFRVIKNHYTSSLGISWDLSKWGLGPELEIFGSEWFLSVQFLCVRLSLGRHVFA